MHPLLCGESESELLELANGLMAGAHVERASVLCAATRSSGEFELERGTAGDVSVLRARRADLHPEHWQKSLSVDVRSALREELAKGEIDLVHVLSWRGLTRDLLATAAAAGVPGVLSLQDDTTSCLLKERVQPATGEPCELVSGAGSCLSCARSVPPRTEWVPLEAQFMAFATRSQDLARELRVARTVTTASTATLERLRMHGAPLGEREVEVLDLGDRQALGALQLLYARAVTEAIEAGSEDTTLGSGESAWYEERMARFAEKEWDRKCREQDA